MWYLIGEIVLFLSIAAIFGFIIGWYLQRFYKKREIAYLESIWKANIVSLERELEAKRPRS
jgi:hypothetical protein